MFSRVIDLTLPVAPGMLTYPTKAHVPVAITPTATIPADGRAACAILIGSHCGTHMDAPRHFLPDGPTLDAFPAERFAGEAVCYSFAPAAPEWELTEEAFCGLYEDTGRPKRVLLHFGWDRMWGGMDYYRRSPWLSDGLCEFLAASGVELLGMDIPSPDRPAVPGGPDSPHHKRLMAAGMLLVEYLCNLGEVPALRPILFCALPLRVMGTDASPVRAVALY